MKPWIPIERIPDPFASIYEKATRMVIDSYYREVAEEVVSHLKAGIILDLGTGPGYLPIEILKRSEVLKINGIDLGHKLIKMAKANAVKTGLTDRLHFEVGNAANLRFEGETYDMIISTGMLHMVMDPVKVLRECYRVLKQGGEAWIYDPAQVSSQVDTEKWRASFNFRERVIYRLFPLYQIINPPHAYDRKDIEEMITKTRFKIHQINEEGKEIKVKLRK
jgi:ubiquinone/menaquinone biosynthesis C-methylase UbiE